ncbi:MAG: 2,3-bisphosphoglycerate-independent phosphoglycerate mutase [Patescibacteria group bacterium]|jgi:2,3-bisphosphoglycerate-independent phosphoglycerate mutase
MNTSPLVLAILDGYGIASDNEGNAVARAKKPNIDAISLNGVTTALAASGAAVGLLDGEAGNSEAGHMNLGAGRIVEQQVRRISRDIQEGNFFNNAAFLKAAEHAKKGNGRVHLMGLLSTADSPHSNPEHLAALRRFCKEQSIQNVYLHLFTDGRDSSPTDGERLLKVLVDSLQPHEKVVTIIGRAYAMDRKKDWKQIKHAYNALVLGEGERASQALQGLRAAYKRGETDEFITPTIIDSDGNGEEGRIQDGDAIIFFNFRPDRARELCKAFLETDFEQGNQDAFAVRTFHDLCFVTLVDYGPSLPGAIPAYSEIQVTETFPMLLSGLRQLYVGESEKFAHVTYFFNGGHPGQVAGETQERVLSPDVVRYAKRPLMAASAVTDVVVAALQKQQFDVIVVNFANPDMLGHTGDIAAAIVGIEEVDRCLGRINEALEARQGTLVITADHGNAECMLTTDGAILTKHTASPVPLIIRCYGKSMQGKKLAEGGVLGDVAPTLLALLDIRQPAAMIGHSLLQEL